VRLDEVCIAAGQVALRPDDARNLLLRRLDGCTAISIGKQLVIAPGDLSAELQNKGAVVLEIEPRAKLPKLAGAAADGGTGPARLALSGKLAIGDDMLFDGYVALRRLDQHTLQALAVDGSFLHAPVSLDAHAHTTSPTIKYQVDVLAGASNARLTGTWTEQKILHAKLTSSHLDPRAFSDAQLDPASFELDALVDLSKDDRVGLEAQLKRPALGTLPLPDVSLRATRMQSGVIDVAKLVLKQASAVISATGRLAADGGMRAQADVSVPQLSEVPAVKRAVPDLEGNLTAQLQLQRARGGDIAADVTLGLRSLQLQANRADTVDLTLHARGAPARPELDAHLSVQGIMLGKERVTRADLTLAGGPTRYDLTARAPDHDVVLDGYVMAEQPGWSGAFELGAKLFDEKLSASLKHVLFVPNDSVRIDQLRAEYVGARVFADGQISLGAHPELSSLRFGVTVPKLADLSKRFMDSDLPGRIEAVGGVKGALDQPALEARLRWLNGPRFAKHETELSIYTKIDLAAARADADVRARAGKARADMKLRSRWRKGQPLTAAVESGQNDVTLETRGISLEALASSGDRPPPVGMRGLLSGQLELHGNQRDFKLDTHWQADVRAGRDPNALALALHANYEKAKVLIELSANDQFGRLLDFDYHHDLDVPQLMAASKPLAELVQQTVWEANAKFNKRRVRELPLVRGLGLGQDLAPLTVETTMHVKHQPGSEPTGELKTDLVWEPSASTEALLAPCSQNSHGNAQFTAKLDNGEVALALTSHEAEREVARIESGLHAKLADLLAGRTDHVGPTAVTMTLTDFELAQVPIVCERGRGSLTAQIKGTDLFATTADFDMKLEGRGMSWDESPTLDVRLNGKAEDDHLRVRTKLQTDDGELRIDGILPIGFRGRDPLLLVNRSGPVNLTTHWHHVDVASLLAYVPAIARASGHLNGQIDVTGPLNQPIGRGQLQFDDVSFTLPRLGQRFSHLNLKAQVDNRTLRLSEGKFKDLDGSATLAAQVSFKDPQSISAELNLNVRNFPVRRSGVMMGRADADINVVGKTNPGSTDVQVTLKNVAIELTTSDMSGVQSLERDPEIEFTDALISRDADKDQPVEDPNGSPSSGGPPVQISIQSPTPMWVRRDDFAVQMSAKLKIVVGNGPPDMTGTIDLIRGYISLLGTSFDIKRGKVTFTGGEKVDPLLEVTAEHDANNGDKIKVEVTGFVQAPKLAFYVNDEAVTAGDAIAAISGRGNSGGGNAEQAMASAAIGMTTGLLSLGARREFGDWVPMLSIEQGAQTKVRVGVEADRFIPSFLKGFVHGAYVEGIVASGDANNGSGAASQGSETNVSSGTGVLLELMLPKSFVWAGQYGPGDAWSVDLDWRP
jgi:translocation and assembly module TamB